MGNPEAAPPGQLGVVTIAKNWSSFLYSRIFRRNLAFPYSIAGMWRQASYKKCFLFLVLLILLLIIGNSIKWQGEQRPAQTAAQELSKNSNSLGWVLRSQLDPGRRPMGAKIPKIFHQTYRTEQLPSEYRPYVTKCRNLNTDWRYYLWRDEDIEQFIVERFPQYSLRYSKFHSNLQRADFIRYMVLYHYGGVYLDMDVDCLRPLFPGLEGHTAFLDQERREHAQILYNREFSAMNSAMGSVARHPFFLYMMETVANSGTAADIGHTTGPDRLTLSYAEWLASAGQALYPVSLLEPAVFSPVADVKLHKFHEKCSSNAGAVGTWFNKGCELLKAKNWKADVTDHSTIGKHLFLHMGYGWGPKAGKHYDMTKQIGPVYLYKQHRMEPKD